jgi:hypothetical protein
MTASAETSHLRVGIVGMAVRQLRRDLRAGELRLLVVALVIAGIRLLALGIAG